MSTDGYDDVDPDDEPPIVEPRDPASLPDPSPIKDLLDEFAGYLGAANRRKALRRMPYSDYLLTDHWRATRKFALDRAGYRCQLCGGTRQLEVHHLTYERLGAEDDGDLAVLCGPCHGKAHVR